MNELDEYGQQLRRPHRLWRISAVAKATGLSRNTIASGMQELQAYQGEPLASAIPEQIRRAGGGRKRLEEVGKTLLDDLESLVEPTTRGDPQSALRWTCKSVDKLAEQLQSMGHEICAKTVYILYQGIAFTFLKG